MAFSFDVAVAWRIYPKVSKTPLLYRDDKFSLVKLCLKSFQMAANGLKIKYFFILDGCPVEYYDLINTMFQNDHYELITTNNAGNLATFQLQVDILSSQTDAPLVYFAEDDYLYIPNSFGKIVDLFNTNKDTDFATCYFHGEILKHPLHKDKKDKIVVKDQQWMTSSSTCLTFMTTQKTLINTKKILETYSKGNNDCAMWLLLTKKFIYNPLYFIKFYFTHKESYNILKTGVKNSFRHFFTLRKYNLWVPDPALATHLETEFVSPGIDWIQLADQLEQNY